MWIKKLESGLGEFTKSHDFRRVKRFYIIYKLIQVKHELFYFRESLMTSLITKVYTIMSIP